MTASQQHTSLILPLLRTLSASICLSFAATSGYALTIGNVRGAVLIGKAVNVTLPVQLDAGEVASAVCTEVELYYADNRVEGSRVRTRWDAPDAKGEAVLRIQSTASVDEPMVSITVRVGCSRKTERRYVLLADLPTEASNGDVVTLPIVVSSISSNRTSDLSSAAVKSPVAPPLVVKPPVTKVVPKPLAATAPKARIPKVTPLTITPMVSIKPDAVVAVPVATPVPASSAPAAKPLTSTAVLASGSAQPKPRLTLESLPASTAVNSAANANTGLKSSWELITVPADNDQARAEAKALWRSLNPQAEDAQRASVLETQVKALQATTAKNQAAQNALKEQLANAEGERYTNGVVGVLAALLVCALAGATYLWLRMRRLGSGVSKDWWRSESVEPSILSDLAPVATTSRASVRGRASGGGKQSRTPDVDLGVDESMFDSLKPKSPVVVRKASRPTPPPPDSIFSPKSGFFNSSMGSRAVNVEELFDIQQQAEFFVSLGQHEQAIELLRQHIYGATSTSGLAYLDLLQLYHKFNRRQEYDQLRDEFNHSFNAKVPSFEQFNQQNRGIERYPSAMSRIEAAWKTTGIAQVLHDCIFRKPDIDDSEAFDLEAYRELLLLFSIANAVAEGGAGAAASGYPSAHAHLDPLHDPLLDFGSIPSQFASSNLPGSLDLDTALLANANNLFGAPSAVQPGAVSEPGMPRATPSFNLPKPSKNLGLDVDLFELESVMSPPAMTTLPDLPQPPVHDLPSLDFSLSVPAAITPQDSGTSVSAASPLPAMFEMPSVDLDLHDFFTEEKKPNLP